MTKKWTNKPDDIIIEPGISFFKKFTVTDTMQHQSKPAFKIHLRNIEIRNISQPPVPSLQ